MRGPGARHIGGVYLDVSFPNSTAQQPRQTRQKGAYQFVENLSKIFFVLGALAYFQVPPLRGSREEKWRSQ